MSAAIDAVGGIVDKLAKAEAADPPIT